MSRPPTDGLADLRSVPGVKLIGREVEWVASTGSTNDDMKLRARGGAAEGLVLVTDEQTAGRGRRGRSWQAPPTSSLLQSILLRPTWLAITDGFLLTMLAAVAAAEAIEALTSITVGLKWPNDLQYADHKLGGILVETELRDGAYVWAVIGLGLNVNWDPSSNPLLINPATSLAAAQGSPVDRVALCTALVQAIDGWYERLRDGARSALFAAWQARLTTLGREIHAETPEGLLSGRAEGVDQRGSLLLRTADGLCHTLHAGEITVRPAPGSAHLH
ncbi:MAG: biotin--[acetyl-CoA-carboxylase] ligase [Herpetosiphonaceae bacterium]|nr:biotin--[acetyl-CoA-carboxylase] ligase [Herpetosiphonaceae bacterium]